jgi:type II secretory pathway pseudopilin PulG
MIEIAISLAVIGFALAAIIGILPTGMNVQQANREETTVDADASVFMNAIRYGEQGLDDLTNYVVTITRYWRDFPNGAAPGPINTSVYSYTNNLLNNNPVSPPLQLTNGYHIVGVLSTPKWVPYSYPNATGYYSNYVVATVRSVSGLASEKYPQDNPTVQDLALNYRLIPEVVPHAFYPAPSPFYATPSGFYPSDWTNYLAYTNSINPGDWQSRSNFWLLSQNLQTNLSDVRLIFRWPLINGTPGNNRQVFRTLAGGHVSTVYEPWVPSPASPNYALYFFEPRNYVKAQ